METRKFLVTNSGEGSICVTGRNRIDIPGLCVDAPIELPENTARQTVARLKQRYPLLKITEVKGGAEKGAASSGASAQGAPVAPNSPQGASNASPTGEKTGTSGQQAGDDAKKKQTAGAQ